MMVDIPGDILNLVLDCVQSDLHTLFICSCVSKEWLSMSRCYVFRTIILTPRNTKSFLALLSHPYTSLSDCVRHVEVHDAESSVSDSESYAWMDQVLSVLGALTAATSFRLRDIHWTDSEHGRESDSGFIPTSVSTSTVKELELCRVEVTSITQILHLICAFPLLETLSLSDLVWDGPSSESLLHYTAFRIPRTLHTVSLDSCYKRDIIRWFLAQNPIPMIPHLNLDVINPADAPAIGHYLKAVGPALQSLRFGLFSLDSGGDAEDFHSSTDLSFNTTLRSICFDYFIYFSVYQFTSAVPWILSIIAQIQSTQLEKMTFVVYISSLDDLEPVDHPVDWTALDHLVTGYQFASLRSVCFRISGGIDFAAAGEAITKKLPRCDESRVLVLVNDSEVGKATAEVDT